MGGPCMLLLKSVVIVVTVTPSVALPTVSAVVIIAVNIAPVVLNLLSLINAVPTLIEQN